MATVAILFSVGGVVIMLMLYLAARAERKHAESARNDVAEHWRRIAPARRFAFHWHSKNIDMTDDGRYSGPKSTTVRELSEEESHTRAKRLEP